MADEFTSKLDAYLDGELPASEMAALDQHVRGCTGCAADVLRRVQLKRAVHSAGARYQPSAEFRVRIQNRLRPRSGFRMMRVWAFAAALAGLLLVASLTYNYFERERLARNRLMSEVVDLHVAALADPNPVQVASSDRHTVKPWFQGKIPFTFNLPELQNTNFALVGGRLTYLEQAPSAELIYSAGKHYISVFILRDEGADQFDLSPHSKHASFSLQSFSQGGLRYLLISDAGSEELTQLGDLLKSAQQ